jgi:hypothetical protein
MNDIRLFGWHDGIRGSRSICYNIPVQFIVSVYNATYSDRLKRKPSLQRCGKL